MTEHEKLKEICDKIGYKPKFDYIDDSMELFLNNLYSPGYYEYYNGPGFYRIVDVREIIFTSEFIEKYRNYLIAEYEEKESIKYEQENFEDIVSDSDIEMQVDYEVGFGLIYNLDNLVDYIYNILKLGKK